MNKLITTISFLNTPEGIRMSLVYSEVDDKGVVIKANIRENRVLLDKDMIEHYTALKEFAQNLLK